MNLNLGNILIKINENELKQCLSDNTFWTNFRNLTGDWAVGPFVETFVDEEHNAHIWLRSLYIYNKYKNKTDEEIQKYKTNDKFKVRSFYV